MNRNGKIAVKFLTARDEQRMIFCNAFGVKYKEAAFRSYPLHSKKLRKLAKARLSSKYGNVKGQGFQQVLTSIYADTDSVKEV